MYTPALSPEISSTVEVKPFGPVQLYVAPEILEAVRLMLAPSQIGPLFPAFGDEGIGLIVMGMILLRAGLPVGQGVIFDVNATVKTSPFDIAEVVYVGEFGAPIMLIPFLRHWYTGDDPPFSGIAVNVTDVPAQIVVELAEILTLTGI
jgi:hypothetical protein